MAGVPALFRHPTETYKDIFGPIYARATWEVQDRGEQDLLADSGLLDRIMQECKIPILIGIFGIAPSPA
jgi:hypothetical protein